MGHHNSQFSSIIGLRYIVPAMVIFWFFGLAAGMCLWSHHGFDLGAFLTGYTDGSSSILGLLLTSFFPFAISSVCVLCHLWYLGPFLMFAFAFLDGYIGCAIYGGFGRSGWLALPILQFSSVFCAPGIWFFWISGLRQRSGVFLCCAIFCAAVFLSDYFFVTPFLESILLL